MHDLYAEDQHTNDFRTDDATSVDAPIPEDESGFGAGWIAALTAAVALVVIAAGIFLVGRDAGADDTAEIEAPDTTITSIADPNDSTDGGDGIGSPVPVGSPPAPVSPSPPTPSTGSGSGSSGGASAPKPGALVATTVLALPEGVHEGEIIVSNSGGTKIEGIAVVSADPAIAVNGLAGELSAGQSDAVAVSVDVSAMGFGPYSVDMTINSNGGAALVTITGTKVPAPAELEMPKYVLIGATGSASFDVHNSGDLELGGLSFANVAIGMTFNGLPPSLGAGESASIDVTMDTGPLPYGLWEFDVDVVSDAGTEAITVWGIKIGFAKITAPDSLLIPSGAPVSAFTITNEEGFAFNATITSSNPLFSVPGVVSLEPGDNAIPVVFGGGALPAGALQTSTLTIVWDGGSSEVDVTKIGP